MLKNHRYHTPLHWYRKSSLCNHGKIAQYKENKKLSHSQATRDKRNEFMFYAVKTLRTYCFR